MRTGTSSPMPGSAGHPANAGDDWIQRLRAAGESAEFAASVARTQSLVEDVISELSDEPGWDQLREPVARYFQLYTGDGPEKVADQLKFFFAGKPLLAELSRVLKEDPSATTRKCVIESLASRLPPQGALPDPAVVVAEALQAARQAPQRELSQRLQTLSSLMSSEMAKADEERLAFDKLKAELSSQAQEPSDMRAQMLGAGRWMMGELCERLAVTGSEVARSVAWEHLRQGLTGRGRSGAMPLITAIGQALTVVNVAQPAQASQREGRQPDKEKLKAWVAQHPVLQRDERDVVGGLLLYLGREIALDDDVVVGSPYDASKAGASIINEAYRVIMPGPRRG